MEELEKGKFFRIHTENRKNALIFLQKKLKTGTKDKGRMVRLLHEEKIYKQKKDCRDFILNCIRSENIEVVSISQRRIALTSHQKQGQKEVKS